MTTTDEVRVASRSDMQPEQPPQPQPHKNVNNFLQQQMNEITNAMKLHSDLCNGLQKPPFLSDK